jgi:predicted HicB family RNase H-like nuclease
VKDLKKAFRESVDDYLAFCESRGEAPERPFSGKFPVRVSPGLHAQIAARAHTRGKSLNAYIAEVLAMAD